jgi:hypothetical protein
MRTGIFMASPTAEQAGPSDRVVKQYRLLYRSPDGSATFESVNDTEGSELLTVCPDGLTFSHVIVGLCSQCATGDVCGLGPDCPRVKSEERDRRFRMPAAVADPVPVVVADVGPIPERFVGSGPKVYVRPTVVEPQVPGRKRSRLRRGKGEPVSEAATGLEAAELEPLPVVVEPAAVPEPPPVVDPLERQAREFGVTLWNGDRILRSRFPAGSGEALAHAEAMGWLRVSEGLVVRGTEDPRPPEPPVSEREQRSRWGPGWD